ncbi:MAG: hypothetical protein LUF87_02165 [Alistipes sp.]|nr:hypothetical protein [Alistipes sp.]
MLKGVPILRTGTIGDDFFGYHEILFTPAIEKFIFSYLLTGNTQDMPKFDIGDKDIPHWAEEDHIYKHIKREIKRGGDKYTHEEEIHNDIKGIRFTANYPYGSIDYGFFPYSWDELNNLLESIEAYSSPCPEQDIPVLDTHTLPTEIIYLKEGKHLDSVLPEIPTNTIINKTICGCGATYLEITNKNRNSIIIETNVPVIIGKQLKHPNLIGVYGEKITAKDIAERISEQTGTIKIMTTPDS